MATSKPKTPGSTPPATTPATTAHSNRVQARVEEIDFSASATQDDLKREAPERRSPWMDVLDKLYQGTVDGKVPRDDNGQLKFIQLGHFQNPGGARTQVKAFEDKNLTQTYEFHTKVKGNESFLFARVKEVPDTPAATPTA